MVVLLGVRYVVLGALGVVLCCVVFAGPVRRVM